MNTRHFYLGMRAAIGFAVSLALLSGSSPVNAQRDTDLRQGDAERFIDDFVEEGAGDDRTASSDDPWLGIMLDDADEQTGAVVRRVFPSGPAARAGLRQGDVIQRLDGQSVVDAEDVVRWLSDASAGDVISLTIVRDGERRKFNATLGRARDFVDPPQTNTEDDDFHEGVSESAMRLEFDRRVCEQHERLEQLLHELLDKVEQLQADVDVLKRDRSAAQ